jgi:lipopolysaccharide transport system permease protein
VVEVAHYFELIRYKAYAELRAEAARVYAGFMWWFIEPLLYMLVFYVVFGLVFEHGGKGFVPFLLCGLVVWKWFASTVSYGSNAILANAGLMQQVYVPKFVFPSVVVLANTAKFLLILALFIVFLTIYGFSVTTAWVALPILIVTQLLLIVAVTWLAAAIIPFVPDMRFVIDNGLTMLFFLSGIFFKLTVIPDHLRWYFSLNPMFTLIEAYRRILLDGRWPDWEALGVVVLCSVLGIWLAKRLFSRFDRLYPKLSIT